MDLTCFNWIQLIKKSSLPPNAKYIAFYLSTFMNMEHRIAWPSQSRIARETGLSDRTVGRQIKTLSDEHWLTIKKAAKAKPADGASENNTQIYHHNVYEITIPEAVLSTIRGDIVSGQGVAGVTGGGSRGDTDDRADPSQCRTNNNKNNNSNNNKDVFHQSHKPFFSHAEATHDNDKPDKEAALTEIRKAAQVAREANGPKPKSERTNAA